MVQNAPIRSAGMLFSVEIDVTDFETDLPVGNSSVEVSQTQALLETEVIQGLTDQQGRIKLDLQQPGSYLVQVVCIATQ